MLWNELSNHVREVGMRPNISLNEFLSTHELNPLYSIVLIHFRQKLQKTNTRNTYISARTFSMTSEACTRENIFMSVLLSCLVSNKKREVTRENQNKGA